MTVFDYIVEQLLEILRLAIYRYAKREAPARSLKRRDAERPARAVARRRRSGGWGNVLMTVLVVIVGALVLRRMMNRRS
jgi:hypothetical protein